MSSIYWEPVPKTLSKVVYVKAWTFKNLLNPSIKFDWIGELLLIIDYCRFGNLQSYLIKQRNKFLNQLDDFGNLNLPNEFVEISAIHWYK